jgi:quinoprotein glucose dehydrogenase
LLIEPEADIQRFAMSARLQIISLVSLLLNGCITSFCADPRQSHREWQVYGGDFDGAKYSALDQINRTNINKLKPAWIYRCDDMRDNPASTIECNPIIVDGVMFITTWDLRSSRSMRPPPTQRWVFDP